VYISRDDVERRDRNERLGLVDHIDKAVVEQAVHMEFGRLKDKPGRNTEPIIYSVSLRSHI
jgi:hypothetical protein